MLIVYQKDIGISTKFFSQIRSNLHCNYLCNQTANSVCQAEMSVNWKKVAHGLTTKKSPREVEAYN